MICLVYEANKMVYVCIYNSLMMIYIINMLRMVCKALNEVIVIPTQQKI